MSQGGHSQGNEKQTNLQYVLETNQTKHVYIVNVAKREKEELLNEVHILPNKVKESVFYRSGEDTRNSCCHKGKNDVGETRRSRLKAFQNLRFQNKRRNQQRRQEEGAVSEIGGNPVDCGVLKAKSRKIGDKVYQIPLKVEKKENQQLLIGF